LGLNLETVTEIIVSISTIIVTIVLNDNTITETDPPDGDALVWLHHASCCLVQWADGQVCRLHLPHG
jgi:hypothetical protein